MYVVLQNRKSYYAFKISQQLRGIVFNSFESKKSNATKYKINAFMVIFQAHRIKMPLY